MLFRSLASRALGVVDAALTGADVVCCGHDHEERIEEVESAKRRFVVSAAGTMTTRTRGGRPGSWNLIERAEGTLAVSLYEWVEAQRDFAQAQTNELGAVLAYDLSLVDFEAIQQAAPRGAFTATTAASAASATGSTGSTSINPAAVAAATAVAGHFATPADLD